MKFIFAYGIRFITRILYLFPIKKNRILFSAYDGKHVCCNPKAIFEYMITNYPKQFEYIWTLDKDEELDPYNKEKVIAVKMRSLRFYYMKATAKVCVCNAGSFPELPLRPTQFQINTHHGGGSYKTAGIAIRGANTKTNLKKIEWDAENTSIYLSSSRYFTEEVIRKQKKFDGEVYEYGMPRNDVLVNHTENKLKEKVYDYYKLADDIKIVLYAPTYRDMNNQYESIDVKKLINALTTKFGGKWVCMIRMHYLGKANGLTELVIWATDYPDMQDLLAASEVLVSDYSSSIWDFSFTGRPCLLYAPDSDLYVEKRGLDTPIETWGFPVCKTNEILCNEIMNWNQKKFSEKMEAHHKSLGSYETGKATELICKRICKECFGGN